MSSCTLIMPPDAQIPLFTDHRMMCVCDGLGDFITLLLTRDLVKGRSVVLIAIAFLFCLTRPSAKRYFKEGV